MAFLLTGFGPVGDSFRAEGSLSATGDSKLDGELFALRFIELRHLWCHRGFVVGEANENLQLTVEVLVCVSVSA